LGLFLRRLNTSSGKINGMNRTPFPTDITHQDIAPTFIDGANITGVDAIDIESLLDVIEKKSSVIEEQKQRIEVLEEYLRLERARRFGPSSEKNSAQAEILFDEAEALEDISAATTALEALQEQTGTPKKRGRKGLSKQLPRHQVHINLNDEEKAGAIDTFYTLAKEELDVVPAKARVIEYLQEKAVFPANPELGQARQIKSAKLPKHPLNKCIASISLLAYVIVSKYCDGLPLYGLEAILKRYGGDISRTSMANWVIRLSTELQPLINLMREHQLAYDYLQIDETRIKVLKEVGKSPSSDKWMWVSKGGPPDKPVILFDYDPSRSAEVATRLLDGFEGYLQCDGMGSYDAIWHRKGLKQLGCFDHARRKYVEAQKAAIPSNKKKAAKVSKADVGLGKINALYRLERSIKDSSAQEKYQKRQEIAVPLLNDLKVWLEQNMSGVMKGGLTYKAMYYTLNQWPKLIRYCEDGRLNISNAGAENAIRPFAVGRRRWLFSDTTKGAHASAIHYSLVETAKANGLNPDEYYQEILAKIPYADTVEKWEELLPWAVKARIEKNKSQNR
jgi:transposase